MYFFRMTLALSVIFVVYVELQPTMGIDFVAYGYAALVATGGVIGYAKAGSTASLGAGLLFGAVLAYGAYQTSQNPSSYLVGLSASALLAGVMGNRYFHSGKFMPAGLLAAVSTAMVLRYAIRSFTIKQQ